MARTSRQRAPASGKSTNSTRHHASAFAIFDSDGLASRVIRRGSAAQRAAVICGRPPVVRGAQFGADGHAEVWSTRLL